MSRPHRPHHCTSHRTYQAGCADCQATARKWQRIRSKENAYYGPRMVPADQSRNHMQRLIQAGMTPASIARAAGVAQATTHRIAHGQRETIHRMVHNKIMGVTHAQARLADGYLPTIGLSRRIQHLYFMGWTGAEIARRVGVEQGHIYRIAEHKNRTIRQEMHHRVMDVYRELWDQDGGSVRAKNTARRNGWVSIFAWSEPDDPNRRPTQLKDAS